MASQAKARQRNLPLLDSFLAGNPCTLCGCATPGLLRVMLPKGLFWSKLANGSSERFMAFLDAAQVRCRTCLPRRRRPS